MKTKAAVLPAATDLAVLRSLSLVEEATEVPSLEARDLIASRGYIEYVRGSHKFQDFGTYSNEVRVIGRAAEIDLAYRSCKRSQEEHTRYPILQQ